MQTKLGILFLSIYLLGILRPLTPVLDYAINWEYITEVFCENKEEVVYVCHGQCHLQKEFKKIQEEESQPTESNNSFKTIEYQFWVDNTLSFLPKNRMAVFQNIAYVNSYFFIFQKDVFHPPILA